MEPRCEKNPNQYAMSIILNVICSVKLFSTNLPYFMNITSNLIKTKSHHKFKHV